MQIVLPKLEKYQKALFRQLDKARTGGKQFVVKSIRQVGKSTALELLLIYASMKEQNSVSLSISPTLAQSRKQYNDIIKIAADLIYKSNGTLLNIEFFNGSVIQFGSEMQGDTLRGFTVKGNGILCVDEAAYIDSDFFYSVLLPTTNVFRSNIFICSTPRFRQGLFYDLWCKGQDEFTKNVIAIDWTDYDTSKFLTKEMLEMYRKQLPKLAFQCEYLGQFVDGDGVVFTDFKKCTGNYKLQKNKELVLSIDWACGNGGDYTVITEGQFEDNKIKVSKQFAFNDKKPTDTVDFIYSLILHYVEMGYKDISVIVESNSIGAIYYSMLFDKIDEYETQYNDTNWREQISIDIIKFTTTNKSKKRIVEQLEHCFETDAILIPNDDKLLTELSSYEAKVDANGTITYNGATGFNDDRAMSLMFLVDYYYNKIDFK